MLLKIKNNTKQAHIMIDAIPDRLYITPDLWVTTAYGKLKIGVENGPNYTLKDGELIKEEKESNGA